MNSLQYIQILEAFEQFAAIARQCGFYTDEINRMEASLMEMNPINIIKEEN